MIDPRDPKVGLAVFAVLAAPLLLISFGRHQGWEMHRECLEETLARNPEPEPPGSHSPLRQALGLPPASEMTHGGFGQQLLLHCHKMP